MTCTKAPKKQAIFRIFNPISGIFRGYCKTLSTKTRIATSFQNNLISLSSIAKHCPLKQGLRLNSLVDKTVI